ncbi:bifunctional methylenetetrahydrofolate dehydrogenase/methenyltetrahydrofolate cyclohydrolase FolD [Collinsella stercoris]|uniref:bifunctional methylenetetrahydrofolate dehydrogenase/methenyltetrahydrofolate cyclohydrolase FolD n=1 Tax=Collinsella stercoris TaxID=147206 RepID=UPI0023F100E1|nr:bifunctional methylenetetrahydrofolate dehydrogenase/methenyltetrahydrofolate cyclohydrolase FolD [Collinsella stercoris]MBS5500289.1 bifunctional methylenetetrahydrofolate dehydrogenase/methenyltetrahydrofolate cyclohydrolase FolD [Collinsella stercoris]MEE0476081.1 bifunctional methylenetetrahydrofolate dehydrogenase/methenyltetrahydrofolate cyclohydrolase FolD [Collinsella stercoris]
MALRIDGKRLAADVRARAAAEVAELAARGIPCGLAVVLVGDDQGSATYVRAKLRDCEQCGIPSRDFKLPEQTTQDELMELVRTLNDDPGIAGILVQMPLPRHLDAEAVVAAIDPTKDVDGFHPENLGRLVRGLPGLRPCTPAGIMEMLDAYDIDVSGKNAVIVGRSSIVGKPMSLMLLAQNATISVAHSHTDPRELARICQSADILVAACGIPKMIKGPWIKPGAAVIDVGMDRDEDGKLCGDVDFDSAELVAGAITPVPGGVGPMTRAMLMSNVVMAAKMQHGLM